MRGLVRLQAKDLEVRETSSMLQQGSIRSLSEALAAREEAMKHQVRAAQLHRDTVQGQLDALRAQLAHKEKQAHEAETRAENAEASATERRKKQRPSSSSSSHKASSRETSTHSQELDSAAGRLSFFEAVEAYSTYQSYTAVKEVGRGTTGRAVLLQSERTGDRVVGKVMLLEELRNPGDLTNVEQEVHMLTAIRHKHVIEYIATFQVPDPGICVLMEYAAGGDLAKVVRTAQREMRALSRRDRPDLRPADVISSAQIGTWLAQIASALQYVHEMRVLHRDLAPKNVLLTIDKQCKVSDFGLSFQMTQSNCGLAKSMVGTPYYMAPEVRPTSGCLPSNFPVPYTPFRSPQRRSSGTKRTRSRRTCGRSASSPTSCSRCIAHSAALP